MLYNPVSEKIETIDYAPSYQGTGDLEAATNTISATSKPGTADYSKSLTLAKPSDARLVIKRIAARLEVTRDSGTSNNLYCTVSVDSADGSSNILFDAVDVQANNLQATNLTSGTVFDLLTDGSAHTFYFFFWVDSGDSVISLVELWEGVGVCSTSTYEILRCTHTGQLRFASEIGLIGTGSKYLYLRSQNNECLAWGTAYYGNAYLGLSNVLIDNHLRFIMKGTVTTDLVYLRYAEFVLRSEQ